MCNFYIHQVEIFFFKKKKKIIRKEKKFRLYCFLRVNRFYSIREREKEGKNKK